MIEIVLATLLIVGMIWHLWVVRGYHHKLNVLSQKQADEFLDHAIEIFPVPIIVTDPSEGVTLMVNQPSREMFSLKGEGRGLRVLDYYRNPKDRDLFLAKIDQQGWMEGMVVEMLRTDGTPLWVEFSAALTRYRGKNALVSILVEVTDRYQAEQALKASETNLRNVFDTVPTPLLIVRREDWRVLEMNPAAAHFLGIDGVRLGQLTLNTYFVHSDTGEKIIGQLQEAPSFSEWSIQLVDRLGQAKDILLSAAELEYDGQIQLIIGFVNITEQKVLERQLKQATEEAHQAMLVKNQFVATMSHEIRTPLNGALTMTHLMERTDLNDQQRGYLQAIHQSGESLLALLNDLLDFSTLEAGQIKPLYQPFSIDDLAQQILSLFKIRADEKGISLQYRLDNELPLQMVGDAGRLRQILFNLVGNAVKFTHQGGVNFVVKLRGRRSPDRMGLRFEVQDSGVGIEPQMRQYLFQPFFQGDATIRRSYSGTGLGLALCQRMVHMLGGKIGVDSTPGEGSLFWFELDMDVSFEPYLNISAKDFEANGVGLNAIDVNGLKILLVEDDRINQLAQSAMLEEDGHYLQIADNGQAAIELLESLKRRNEPLPDLILMDIRMPVMDGLSCARALRAMGPPLSKIPIIALTADVTSENRAECAEAGISCMVAKPFLPADLQKEISFVLQKSKISNEQGNCHLN